MLWTFLDHGWKKFTRSASFTREMATTIFLGFIAVMIGGYLLAFGIALPHIVSNVLNKPDVTGFLNSLLLYYFLFDFVVRYLLQSMPVLDVQPYLHLPVRRIYIVHYLLGRSVFHVLNLFALFIFAPTAITVVAPAYGASAAFCWIAGVWSLGITVHFIVMLYKVRLDDSFIGIFLVVAVFSLLSAADYYGWFRLSDVSARLFATSTSGAGFLVATLFAVVSAYVVNFFVFRSSLYPEEIAPRQSGSFGFSEFGFLKHLGLTGEWIGLELKLILRNKRPRAILFLSALFLLYGLIFYPNSTYTTEMPGFLLFVGIFVTGIFMINYGQFLFGWQAGHFDFTATRPVSLEQYINSKYWLLGFVTVICFLLSIPYVFFGWNILLINVAMILFNLGVNIFVIMNLAMWSPKKIDLAKGGAFNIQGAGAAQWVMGLPIFLSPYVFYLPFSLAGYPTVGVLFVGLAGLTGIVCRPYLIRLTARRMMRRKHALAEGFRKED